MTKFTVELNTEILPPHTDAELEKWLEYEIGERGGIKIDNPLSSINLVDCDASLIEFDTEK